MVAHTSFTIKQAAQQLDVSVHTLRYYEREGLLGIAIKRNSSGHREYSTQDLLWFKLLLCLRQTGMSIEDVKEFAAMSQNGTSTLAARHALLLQHRSKLSNHIAVLQKMLTMLDVKVARYEELQADEQAAKALDNRLRQS